ncbi:NUDIX domain-containing protein [[Kitasatospora] papulosa]|uniref:NUDIX domain-containing protein n=1 Tax=[Kitasatospora] papulosa TaxID=1464011 RepID=UPI0036B357F5
MTCDPALAAYLAAHSGPLLCVDAIVRTADGRMLVLDPPYKPGWDLPGGMNEDELPVAGLMRELHEELGLRLSVGRLLAVDVTPPEVYGRTLLSWIYAVNLPAHVTSVDELRLQADEIAGAALLSDQDALERFPPPLRRRVEAALAAERNGCIAALHDGFAPPAPRTHAPRQNHA